MLVLSRRVNQAVHFPTLGVSIEILQSKGNSVRLGISAPPEVRVLREELLTRNQAAETSLPGNFPNPDPSHEMRGRLNTAVMGLYVVEKQLQSGMTSEAEVTLRESLHILESLEETLNVRQSIRSEKLPQRLIQTLLVEDDPNEEALLASYLRMSGFEVQSVHDGYEALEFLSSHARPDFVLLDMRLPHFDGPSTVAAIRRIPAYDSVKIFAVSGSSRDEVSALPDSGRIDGWFQKPLNPAQLAEAMSTAAAYN